MAFKWGNTELLVIKDTYTPPRAEPVINEIAILAGADNDTPATVLQQNGRGRYTVGFSTFVRDYSTYESLLSDYIDQTERTFTGPDSVSMTMTISSLSPAVRKIYPTRFEFDVTFREA